MSSSHSFVSPPRLQLRISAFRNTNHPTHADVHQAVFAAANNNIDYTYQGANTSSCCGEGNATGA
jgi:hypothetical protein